MLLAVVTSALAAPVSPIALTSSLPPCTDFPDPFNGTSATDCTKGLSEATALLALMFGPDDTAAAGLCRLPLNKALGQQMSGRAFDGAAAHDGPHDAGHRHQGGRQHTTGTGRQTPAPGIQLFVSAWIASARVWVASLRARTVWKLRRQRRRLVHAYKSTSGSGRQYDAQAAGATRGSPSLTGHE